MKVTRNNLRCRAHGGFTLVEVLIALALSCVVAIWLGHMVDWMRESGTRSARVYELLDARSAQDFLDSDLRTAVAILEPASFGEGPALVFENSRAEKITYEVNELPRRGAGSPKRFQLLRRQEDTVRGGLVTRVIAGNLADAVFHRVGNRMAGYHFRFARTDDHPGVSPELLVSSSVTLSNNVY